MVRRPNEGTPLKLQRELVDLLADFEKKLGNGDLRTKVLAMVPVFHKLRDLGSSLIPRKEASAARDRILAYFCRYPLTVIHGDELLVVSGIQDWPRRLRELRREHNERHKRMGTTGSGTANRGRLADSDPFDRAP